ncbi:MAG: threonine--tRNA ligase [Candidatus Dadabacteria bacterium]|nr:threonine--tRNA ligase [Candidatus Dadabacteria bacterium]MDE0519271.1 threonine--tRNA ligase [Candidatus Dadabacteria bacterium]MDE0663078.1 threonine--tRNA ligase [Candidatus Dadabacteria bacterium]
MQVNIDGKQGIFSSGTTVGEALAELDADKRTVGAVVDGQVVDFWHRLEGDCDLLPVKSNTEASLGLLRHTTAHVLAEAVQSLFPEARVTIGPVIENGFYYDFDFKRGFTPEDLENIEARMLEVIKRNRPLVRKSVTREEAVAIFSGIKENYKVEIINDLPEGEEITIYDQTDWYDLCRGPHLPSTGLIKAFKLTSSAGAYWRGNENNPMLQRIYGTAFWDKKDLRKYLRDLEEAKKRDHRKLGRELDLFSVNDEIGPGLILWHPRGARVRSVIEDFWKKEHVSRGYELLYTPHMAKLDLWRTSGHVDFYSQNMFSCMEVESSDYQVKPMNCPFHILIYKSKTRSYRDLPIRWAEIGTVYRYERSGVLHGLLRVRGFSQDDAHIFCRPDQIREEVSGVLRLTLDFLRTFGFDNYEIFLSTRPEKFVGSEENWERSIESIEQALSDAGLPYGVDSGGGAFYGPKIDLKIKDVIGRAWQCSTIQVDFNLPERFEMEFVGEDNARHTPIMIHRAIFGSIERFFGILIEHYGGAFPLWLSPEQVRVASVGQSQAEYCEEVCAELRRRGIRVASDLRNEKLGYKVREAQVMKIPYLLVVGDKEVETGTVAPRKYGGDAMEALPVDDFIEIVTGENDPYSWMEVKA